MYETTRVDRSALTGEPLETLRLFKSPRYLRRPIP